MGKRLKRQLQVRATASTHLRTQVSKVTGGQMGVGKGGVHQYQEEQKDGTTFKRYRQSAAGTPLLRAGPTYCWRCGQAESRIKSK